VRTGGGQVRPLSFRLEEETRFTMLAKVMKLISISLLVLAVL